MRGKLKKYAKLGKLEETVKQDPELVGVIME